MHWSREGVERPGEFSSTKRVPLIFCGMNIFVRRLVTCIPLSVAGGEDVDGSR